MIWIEILVCLLAGAGAGISTGFAGLSAAAFITPMLVGFLNIPVYEAVGIALASDVLASAASSLNYAKQGHLDLKKGRPLLITVFIFTIGGSVASYFITRGALGNDVMGFWSIIACIFLGISFLFRKGAVSTKQVKYVRTRKVFAVLCGVYIGLICGFQGTGGGMMMLFVLTSVMRFEFKTAVGTSVFIMAFTALIGAATHFGITGFPQLLPLSLCVIFTLVFAQWASRLALKLTPRKLNVITGLLLIISGLATLAGKIFW